MPAAESPRPDRLKVSRSHGDPAVVTLDGALVRDTVLVMARAVAQSLAQDPVPEVVVLDLAGVTALTAAGLRVLGHARNHAALCRSTLRFTAPRDSAALGILLASGLYAAFDVYTDRQAALAASDRRSFLDLVDRLWTAGD